MWDPSGEVRPKWRSTTHLEKWDQIGKTGKRDHFEEVGPTWERETYMEKERPIWKSGTVLENWDLFGKVRPI